MVSPDVQLQPARSPPLTLSLHLSPLFLAGFVPRLGNGAVWSYTRWFERALIAIELQDGFGIDKTLFNMIVQPEHEDPDWGYDFAALLFFMLITNAFASILMLVTNREKQR